MKKKHIFTNGTIFTCDDENLYVDTMVIEDGTIIWTGQNKDLPDFNGNVTDLNGKCVIPGFVDAHMHPIMLADFRKKIAIMPPEICSIRDLKNAVRKRRQMQGPGTWIQGWGYDEQAFTEKRSPNRYDLDEACSDAPVSLMRTCAHIRCVNSMALKMANIDRNTPDPPGGEIERDENGEPTGILKENARNLLAPYLPKEPKEQQVENLLELGNLLTSQGITAICDMGNLDASDNIPIYEEACRKGFCQRVGVYYMWDFFADKKESLPRTSERRNRKNQIFMAGLKLIGDGSVSGRTAWMSKPYFGTDDQYGLSVCSDELLESVIEYCKEQGCQLSIHAMGTRAIDRMIRRVKKEKSWTKDHVPYVRIEHVTVPSEESMKDAADHGIAFVTQPIFPYAESASYLNNLGKERIKECYPIKSILEHHVKLGFSTDAPATFWSVPSDPFPGLKMAVTRRAADGTDCGEDEGIDIQTAIELYTKGAAKAAGMIGSGMLKKGYRADFVVLDQNIFKICPEKIDKVRVKETYIGGICVYQKEEERK